MTARHSTGGALRALFVDNVPKVMDIEKVDLAEANIKNCISNGMVTCGGIMAQKLIEELSASAATLQTGQSGIYDPIQAREQALKAVELAHKYQREQINVRIDELINNYYGYPSTIEEEDADEIFELAGSMSETAKERVHPPSIRLLTSFFEKLKMESKTAANDNEHAYSAQCAEIAAIVADRMARMFPDVAIPDGKADYAFLTEGSLQRTYAAQQYSLAALQEAAKQDRDNNKLARYIAKVDELFTSIRSSMLRNEVTVVDALAPLVELEGRMGKTE